MAWGSSSYLDAATMVKYVDWHIFADLLSDTGEPLVSSAAVQADANLTALSDAVSGMFETYLVGTGRYTVAQLQALSGNALAYFQRLLSRMVAVEAYDRRPNPRPDQRPQFYDEARAEFAALVAGEAFLPTS